LQEWSTLLAKAKSTLLAAREKRTRPGLDDKIITSWNSMMITGLTDAYKVFGDPVFLDAAKKNIDFLERNLIRKDAIMRSFKDKPSKVHGFLDDYAFTIQAYLHLYQATFNESYLAKGSRLLAYTLTNFYDPKENFFFYNGEGSEKLIARNKEIYDNVIPASNSIMAQNLFHYGVILDDSEWRKIAKSMVDRVHDAVVKEPSYMSQWAMVSLEIQKEMAEVVFVGTESESYRKNFHAGFHPFALTLGTEAKSDLPLLKEKTPLNNQTTIFVCFNNTCKRPVFSVDDAIPQLNQ
jgi:uncharacterized protein YyaL (SSP411 family)